MSSSGSGSDSEDPLPRAFDGERAALRPEERSLALQNVAAALSEAATIDEIAEVITRAGVTAVGANRGGVYLLEPDGAALRMIAQTGAPPALLASLRHVATSSSFPLARCVAERTPLWLQSEKDFEAFPELCRSLPQPHPAISLCALPLIVDVHTLGALTLGFAEEGALGADVQAFLLTVARLAAHALDRARLYETEKRSNERLRLLLEASKMLASSLEYERTLENVVAMTLPMLGDFGFVDVAMEDGEVHRLARAHDDPVLQALLASTRWADTPRTAEDVCALTSGVPALHPVVDDAWRQRVAGDPDLLAFYRKLGFTSMLSVPIEIRGKTSGALSLFFTRPGRSHTPADLDLACELARRAATAVENARLYADAQRAKRLAEEASRSKEEFLAVVSHELRTPLTAILGWAHALAVKGEDPELLRRGVEVIRRNAVAQVRIIEDLLDISRIVSHNLRLDFQEVDLENVARTAIETLRPAVDAKRLALEVLSTGAAAVIAGDPDRLQQIVWNVLSNAVKFTPEDGRISVHVDMSENLATLTIVDTGAGIERDLLPFVFDRFRQGDASTTRKYGGLGLGLAIVRHLVELHCGEVIAKSEGAGRGATFVITLPRAQPEGAPES